MSSVGNTLFPDQNVTQAERNKDGKAWYKKHLDFADELINTTNSHYRRIDRLFTQFHGKYSNKKFNEWIQRYKKGKHNVSKTKFIDYKLATGKIDRLVGEYLKRPLKPTVLTVNKEAIHEKLEKMSLMLALSSVKGEVDKLRGQGGVDVMGGVPAVDPADKDFISKVNPKTQSEKFMTLVLEEQINRLRLKEFGSRTLQDVLISSECHAHVFLGPNKKVQCDRVHPKDAIFYEIEADDFIERSTIVGFRKESTLNEILHNHSHKLKKDEIDRLKALEGNQEEWSGSGIKYVEKNQNRLIIWETHVYWTSLKRVYEKFVPGKDNEFIDFYKKIITEEDWEKNKKKYQREEKAGKYQIRKSYMTTIFEATRLGKDIYVDMREQPFLLKRDDDEQSLLYNYTGLLLNTVDGIRLSLQEKLQDLNDLYNIVMWQIRREIGKYKGSVLMYDEAFLKKGQTMNDVMYGLSEESIVSYNSNAEENQSARFMESAGMNSQQIGSTDAMQGLLGLKMDIQVAVDRISGINEMREGDIAASQTATGTMQGIAASRTITTPIFYYHSKFLENVFTRVIELTKYSIGVLGDTSFDLIIGGDGVTMMKKTANVTQHDYGTFIADPNREGELREKLTQYGMAAVNAGEVRIQDMLRSEMAATLQDAHMILEDGFKKADALRQESEQGQLQSQEKNVAAQIQAQNEDREDRQVHEKEKIVLQGQVDSGLATQEAQNEQVLQNNASKTTQ